MSRVSRGSGARRAIQSTEIHSSTPVTSDERSRAFLSFLWDICISLSLSLSLLALICRYRGPPTSPLFVRASYPNCLCSAFSSLRGPAVSRAVINSLRWLLLRLVPPSPSPRSPPPPRWPSIFYRQFFFALCSVSATLHCACTPPLKGTFMRLRSHRPEGIDLR